MANKLRKGMLVWMKDKKEQGKLIAIKDNKAVVEVIVNFDKEKGLRTTKTIETEVGNVVKYRKRKPRRKLFKKYNPNEMYYMVREFHKAFGHHVADKPTPIPSDLALNRAVWTGEELVEFLYATVKGDKNKFLELFKQFKEGLDQASQKILDKNEEIEDVVVAQADALTDVAYFNFGTFVHLGVKPFNLFKIVQEANMSKLFPDGKPRYREDGKIIKPEGWQPPEPKLKAEIERQIRQSK
ncbi:hydrolase [Geobacillus virus E3]|uniref:hydrolase n=1 Tax=Geobacillus virus E3 TaxID=1572712 RepID=UPI000671C8F1|nr:hydrolase [Geobacillus virus E3]AJA41399.1 hypothetical protein E3_080 [Geobacillus virus E3]